MLRHLPWYPCCSAAAGVQLAYAAGPTTPHKILQHAEEQQVAVLCLHPLCPQYTSAKSKAMLALAAPAATTVVAESTEQALCNIPLSQQHAACTAAELCLIAIDARCSYTDNCWAPHISSSFSPFPTHSAQLVTSSLML
jgi:hypothetical protein